MYDNNPNHTLCHTRDGERGDLSRIVDDFLASEPLLPPPPARTGLPRLGGRVSIKKVMDMKPASAPAPAASAPAPARKHITNMTSGDNWMQVALLSCDQRQLFGPLWYEGEICILFADTNVGKSLLAVQIADTVSNGRDMHGALPMLGPQTPGQHVIYADFEMSMPQFARRYSSEAEGGDKSFYRFSPNFHRLDLDYNSLCDADDHLASKDFADCVLADLEARVDEIGAPVLIVDNITFLASGTETAADAQPLMKKLISLKKKYGLSILVLAHTPKRCATNPLTGNDIQGSKSLINFADSAFAIGKSVKGTDIRYVKQIKQRNIENQYGAENVIECRVGRLTDDFIGFRAIGHSHEREHLEEKRPRDGHRSEAADRARMMKQQGVSADRIAAELGVNRATVYRWFSHG